VTSLLFDINDNSKGLNKATDTDILNKENLTRFLKGRYASLYAALNLDAAPQKDKLMAKFLKNNETFINANIVQIARYFEVNNVFEAVKEGADKKDRMQAVKTLLNIFQGGLTNEWRETMYERIAGKTQLSKAGIGVGVIFIANTVPMLYPKLSLQITHWRNNYINNRGQKLLDA